MAIKSFKTMSYIVFICIPLLLINCGGATDENGPDSNSNQNQPPDERTILEGIFLEISETDSNAIEFLRNKLNSLSLEPALNETITYLNNQVGVDYAKLTDDNFGIYIKYLSGFDSVIDATPPTLYTNQKHSSSMASRHTSLSTILESGEHSCIVMEATDSAMEYDGPEELSEMLSKHFGTSTVH